MNGNPLRPMIAVGIVLAVVFLGFVAYRFVHVGGTVPAPTPTASATVAPLQTPQPTDESSDQGFHGLSCNPDCSEQISGYNYAQANKVKSRDDCPDQGSGGFSQGCWAYADEHAKDSP